MKLKTQQRNQTIQLALTAYSNNEFPSVRACARAFKIPESTLRCRLNGTQESGFAQRTQLLLTREQEQILTQWILGLDAQGHAPAPAQVRDMVQIIRISSGNPQPISPVGQHWITHFKQRNPQIATILGKARDTARIQGTSPEALR